MQEEQEHWYIDKMSEARFHTLVEFIKVIFLGGIAVGLARLLAPAFNMETALITTILTSVAWAALGAVEVHLLRKYYKQKIATLLQQAETAKEQSPIKAEIFSAQELEVKTRLDQLTMGAREVLRFLLTRGATISSNDIQNFAKKEGLNQYDAVDQLGKADFVRGTMEGELEIDSLLRPTLEKLIFGEATSVVAQQHNKLEDPDSGLPDRFRRRF